MVSIVVSMFYPIIFQTLGVFLLPKKKSTSEEGGGEMSCLNQEGPLEKGPFNPVHG